MDKRLDLLNYLLTQKRTVPNRELQSVLNVSRRTVINYVNEINALASDTVFSSGQGYRCIDSPAVRKLMQDLHNSQSFDSFEKRSSFLFQELMLKSSHPTLDELADEMFISPSTLSNELIRIRAALKEQNLYLKTKNNRLYIIGEDRDIRKFTMSLLSQELRQSHFDLPTMQRFFSHANIFEIGEIVTQALKKHSCFLDDFSSLNYVLHLAIYVETASSAPALSADTDRREPHAADALIKPVRDLVEEIYCQLKKLYQIDFPFEQVLDASLLMATRVVAVDLDRMNFEQLGSLITPEVRELLSDIIVSVHDVYGINLKTDNFMVRFAFHLKNLLERAALRIQIPENNFITMKDDYPFLYVIAEFIASIISRRGYSALPEIEISYIALHLGILMEENHHVYGKINYVLVIYDYYNIGLSISEHIRELTDTLYLTHIVTSYEQIKNLENIDLILTTLPGTPSPDIPVVHIHTLPTEQDYEEVLKTAGSLAKKLHNKELYQKLRHLFDKELFFPDVCLSSREEVIDFLCQKMEDQGYVDATFRDEIHYHEKVAPSAYRNIAMPHPLNSDKEHINTSAIAVLINRHPLPWGDNRVDFVFLLSLRGEDRPLFQDIFTVLSSFLSSEQNCQLLKRCTHFDAFLNLLIQSSRGGS